MAKAGGAAPRPPPGTPTRGSRTLPKRTRSWRTRRSSRSRGRWIDDGDGGWPRLGALPPDPRREPLRGVPGPSPSARDPGAHGVPHVRAEGGLTMETADGQGWGRCPQTPAGNPYAGFPDPPQAHEILAHTAFLTFARKVD